MIKRFSIRTLLSIVLVIVVLGVGVAGFGLLASLREPPEERKQIEKILNVEAYRVEPYPFREYLNAFGTAMADREVVISAEVSGKVVDLHPDLKVGREMLAPQYPDEPEVQQRDKDLQGDLLVQIDPETYRQRVEQATIKIAESQVEKKRLVQELAGTEDILDQVTKEFEISEKDYDRRQQLVDRRVGSEKELTQPKLELQRYEKAKVQTENDLELLPIQINLVEEKLKSLAKEKEIAQEDLNRAEVRAPFSGFLSEVHVEKGQFLRMGDPIVRLTDVRKVEIPVSLTLADYAKLKPQLDRGLTPTATLFAHRGDKTRWDGNVVRIAPEANEQTRTIQVYIEVDNQSQKVPLLPGTFVFARIDGPRYAAETVFVVPRDAILKDEVFLVRDGKAASKQVEVTETLQSVAFVTAGLETGDLLVLSNLDVLMDGTLIDPGDRIRTLPEELERIGARSTSLELLDPADQAAAAN